MASYDSVLVWHLVVESAGWLVGWLVGFKQLKEQYAQAT